MTDEEEEIASWGGGGEGEDSNRLGIGSEDEYVHVKMNSAVYWVDMDFLVGNRRHQPSNFNAPSHSRRKMKADIV